MMQQEATAAASNSTGWIAMRIALNAIARTFTKAPMMHQGAMSAESGAICWTALWRSPKASICTLVYHREGPSDATKGVAGVPGRRPLDVSAKRGADPLELEKMLLEVFARDTARYLQSTGCLGRYEGFIACWRSSCDSRIIHLPRLSQASTRRHRAVIDH